MAILRQNKWFDKKLFYYFIIFALLIVIFLAAFKVFLSSHSENRRKGEIHNQNSVKLSKNGNEVDPKENEMFDPDQRKEIAKLRNEYPSALKDAIKQVEILETKYTSFQIRGELIDFEFNYDFQVGSKARMIGKAFPCNHDDNTRGSIINGDGNIILKNAAITFNNNNREDYYWFCGRHYFIEEMKSTNRFGEPVTWYVYGDEPNELKTAKNKLEHLDYWRARVGIEYLNKSMPESCKYITDSNERKRMFEELDKQLQQLDNSYKIKVGNPLPQLESQSYEKYKIKLPTLKYDYDDDNSGYIYVFPQEGIIVNTTKKFINNKLIDANHVIAITYLIQVENISKYYSYIKKIENLETLYNSAIPYCALSAELSGVRNRTVPELFQVTFGPYYNKNELYLLTYESNLTRSNILAVTVTSRDIIEHNSVLALDYNMVDMDPILAIKNPNKRFLYHD